VLLAMVFIFRDGVLLWFEPAALVSVRGKFESDESFVILLAGS